MKNGRLSLAMILVLGVVAAPGGGPIARDLGFPVNSLHDIPPGEYFVQALVNIYSEFKRADARVSGSPERGPTPRGKAPLKGRPTSGKTLKEHASRRAWNIVKGPGHDSLGDRESP